MPVLDASSGQSSGQSRGNFFRPQGPGFARVTVIDAAGATDSVVVRLDEGSRP